MCCYYVPLMMINKSSVSIIHLHYLTLWENKKTWSISVYYDCHCNEVSWRNFGTSSNHEYQWHRLLFLLRQLNSLFLLEIALHVLDVILTMCQSQPTQVSQLISKANYFISGNQYKLWWKELSFWDWEF